MDTAVVNYVNALHAHFVESHAKVHEDFVVSHEREHSLTNETTSAALKLAAERLLSETENIKTYYDSMMQERDRRYGERFDAQQVAVTAAFTASEKAIESAFVSSEKAIAAAFEGAEKAISKAEIAIEKRADATYVALNELQRLLGNLIPRGEAEARFKNTEERLASLSSRQDRTEAAKIGAVEIKTDYRALIASVVGVVLLLIAVVSFFTAERETKAPVIGSPLSCEVAVPGQVCVTKRSP